MSQLAFVIQEEGAQPKVISVPVPTPGEGEVVVKILAAGINPHEVLTVAQGLFANTFPYILGSDGAGIVEDVGPGVTKLKKGDRVVFQADIFHPRSESATFQQYAKIDAQLVGNIPSNVSIEGAATLPVAITAAFVGLYHKSGLHLTPPWTPEGLGKYKGQGIFIAGGASNVGINAIQLAKLSGFTTIATTASESNHALVKSFGATHAFSRSASASDIKLAIGPVKFAFAAISVLATKMLCVDVLEKTRGSVVIIVKPDDDDIQKSAEPIDVRSILGISERTRDVSIPFWAAIGGWLEDGSIKPTVLELLPGGLGSITTALGRLERQEVSGKKLLVNPQETTT